MLPIKHTASALFLLALSACGGGAEDKADGTAAQQNGPALAEGWTKPDACAVLNKAAYGAAIDQSVNTAELTMPHPSDGTTAATSECFYTVEGAGRYSVLLRWSPIHDNSEGSINSTRSGLALVTKALGGSVETLTGVGKAAFWVERTGSLNVFIGEDRMAIINVPTGAAAKGQAIALAHTLGG